MALLHCTSISVLVRRYWLTCSGLLVRRYWLMCAADEAYALNTSLVGSVGVLMSSWGATEVMKKLGVERRLFTAGARPLAPPRLGTAS